MNLLPKAHEEFGQKDYWESFFKKRGSKAFEWYGEYPELCEHLHKYVKTKDSVLVVGCGNSALSSDLYDIGYTEIMNIDISQVAIRQMLNLHSKERPNLKYLQMDALNMSFDNESFTVVLDKGTLDALMTDDKPETIDTILKYFSEIQRVLKSGGRFICISLLQKHILHILLNYFPDHNWMFRVVRCFDAEKKSESDESSLPVFMVICTKFKLLPRKVLEVNISTSDKMQRLEKTEDVKTLIEGVQQAAFVCSGLRRSNVINQQDVSFDLFQPGNDVPRYTIYIVDVQHEHKNSKYAAFIIPQGREVEWMFSTTNGRKHLTKVAKYNRLAVIITHRGHEYESIESIQNELMDTVCQMAPQGVTGKIPFLSLTADIGSRITRHKSSSDNSGDYIVEDVEISQDSKFRRLFYLNSQNVIQSEAKLKQVRTRTGQKKEVTDHTFLTCQHHTYMAIAAHLVLSKKASASLALLGLGGGSMCMFLRKFLSHVDITAVDIDRDMLEVATTWFGFKSDDKLHVEIIDGVLFLEKSAKSGKKYDVVLMDIDNKDTSIGMMCPSQKFLETSLFENILKCLHKKGLFVLNLVVREESLRQPIINNLKAKFTTIITYKLEAELNEVIICSPEKLQESILTSQLKDSVEKLNEFLQSNRVQDNGLFDIQSFLGNLHIT